MRSWALLLGLTCLPCVSMAGEDSVSKWRETHVTVGAKGWPLPGILTLPESTVPIAAVVLVHGSGPHDADETIFANKPFRDLAHGLADRGIASLRYVKRSREHRERLMHEHPNITTREEVIDDAVAAAEWLHYRPGIRKDGIFILGHSLGAMLAPRIAQSTTDPLAGLILLAGNARPLEDVAIDQLRYLAPSEGITDAQIAEFEQQRERVKALQRGEKIDGSLLFNLPASYWHDLSSSDPVATARTIGMPMLILQGERDYQVTMQDLNRWRVGLADQRNVTTRSYPALNHLFIAGSGASMPAEYFVAGHVDLTVIEDIADWIRTLLSPRPAPSRAVAAQTPGA